MNEKMTAIMNDSRLMDLAKYKCTEGLIKDAQEQDLLDEFASMKKKVMTGKTTLAKLEEQIYSKLGVQEKVDVPKMPTGGMGFNPGMMAKPPVDPEDEKHIAGFGPEED